MMVRWVIICRRKRFCKRTVPGVSECPRDAIRNTECDRLSVARSQRQASRTPSIIVQPLEIPQCQPVAQPAEYHERDDVAWQRRAIP